MGLKKELQSITTEELQTALEGYHGKMKSLASERSLEEFDAQSSAVVREYPDMGRLALGISRLFENPYDSAIAAQALTIFTSVLGQVAEVREMPQL